MCACVHVCMCAVCMYACVHVCCMHVCMYAGMHVRTCVRVYVCTCVRTYLRTCVRTYVCFQLFPVAISSVLPLRVREWWSRVPHPEVGSRLHLCRTCQDMSERVKDPLQPWVATHWSDTDDTLSFWFILIDMNFHVNFKEESSEPLNSALAMGYCTLGRSGAQTKQAASIHIPETCIWAANHDGTPLSCMLCISWFTMIHLSHLLQLLRQLKPGTISEISNNVSHGSWNQSWSAWSHRFRLVIYSWQPLHLLHFSTPPSLKRPSGMQYPQKSQKSCSVQTVQLSSSGLSLYTL